MLVMYQNRIIIALKTSKMNNKQIREITGHYLGNVVMDYFKPIAEYIRTLNPDMPNHYIEYKTFGQGDDVLHMLLFKDKLKAMVCERRDDMNYIEYSFTTFV